MPLGCSSQTATGELGWWETVGGKTLPKEKITREQKGFHQKACFVVWPKSFYVWKPSYDVVWKGKAD
jgi:hypothetical protein